MIEKYKNITPIEDFDWIAYEHSGFVPKRKLKVNKSVVCQGRDRVFSTEPYAQSFYNAIKNCHVDLDVASAKDPIIGTIYSITNMFAVSDTEVAIDTTSGMSAVIDLSKEKQFLRVIGCPSISAFIAALRESKDFKEKILDMNLTACVVEGKRVSLWGGHKKAIEDEFKRQAKNPTTSYEAVVKEVNVGGYIVEINGINCFMPGAMAPAGTINNPQGMIGKHMRVMIINYLPKTNGFVVSHRQYIDTVLPEKIKTDVFKGLRVIGRVTGSSSNAVFVQFQDSEGDWIFSSIIHRDYMSKDFEYQFNNKMIRVGDMMELYVANILPNPNGVNRIVLTDTPDKVVVDKEEDKED